jgi:hypothetical protein
MFELLMLGYALGAVATFFWVGNMSSQEKGFVGAFLIAIPWALIWPVALIVLLLVAEKKNVRGLTFIATRWRHVCGSRGGAGIASNTCRPSERRQRHSRRSRS